MADSVFITPFGGTIVGPVTVSGAILASDGTVSGPSYSFASETNSGLYRAGTSDIRMSIGAQDTWKTSGAGLVLNSAVALYWGSTGVATPDTILARAAAGAIQFKTATATITMTVPTGTANVSPVVVSDPATRKVGATNAQTLAAFTVGAADASFRVSANILVTTATAHAFTVTCAYTDEGNTARTLTMPFTLVAGAAIVNSVANATGTVPYMGITQHIRCKAATTITIATTGTFTTVVYNGEGIIEKVT